jgi:hypothetical protein
MRRRRMNEGGTIENEKEKYLDKNLNTFFDLRMDELAWDRDRS